MKVGKVRNFLFYSTEKKNSWVVQKDDKTINVDVDNIDSFIYLLPILEEEDLSILYKENFPVYLIVEVALSSGSEYWIDKALNHVEANKYVKLLKNIYEDKKYSQRMRHKIKNMIKGIN